MSKQLRLAGEAALSAPSQRVGSPKMACPAVCWIEIAIVGDNGDPIEGFPYSVVNAKGESHRGRSNDQGIARIENLPEGDCAVSFPGLVFETGERPGGIRKLCERHVFTIPDWSVTTMEPVSQDDDAQVDSPASSPDAASVDEDDWELAEFKPIPNRED